MAKRIILASSLPVCAVLVSAVLILSGCALNRNDFPPALRQTLDQRTAELKSNEGICIAGRVKTSDGAHIGSGKDVKINFLQRANEPLWVYDGGWFIMGRTFQPSSHPRPAKIALRAFGYDPIDASIAALQGKITYVEFVMHKTPAEDLATVTGTILNEQNEPFNGANVGISFPYASHGMHNEPYKSVITGMDGKYSFEGLSASDHSLIASKTGYAYNRINFTPPAGKTATKDLKLYQNRSIIIDYVYQADGSRSFTGGDLQTGTIEWVSGNEGVDFSDGRVKRYDPKSLRDIEMIQDQNALRFQIFYCNGKQNGFYEAGAAALDSVTEAAETGYSTEAKPCIAGHTYVVRTYENNYAKFAVRGTAGRESSPIPSVPATDKHPVVLSSLKFSRENFQDAECVKVSSIEEGHEKSYWLDPARGFTLLGYKNVESYEDGSERIVSFIKVTQLKEAADGLWWPTEAIVESEPFKIVGQEPHIRAAYQTSNVTTNDPNSDNSVSTPSSPKDDIFDDKIANSTCAVDANRSPIAEPNSPPQQIE